MAAAKLKRMRGPRKDITGKQYGYWTVLAFEGDSKWKCRCKCGTETIVAGGHLKSGHSKSCGCYKREFSSQNNASKLLGMRFGRLTVLERVHGINKDYNARWKCACDCGAECIVPSNRLSGGHTQSCGCLHKDRTTTHRMSRTRTYHTWVRMRRRCTNRNDKVTWANYGGRGIKVCDRWQGSFENFLADMGEIPVGGSIERINVNGNYEPSNCRWATRREQGRNTRRNKIVVVDGQEMLLTDAIAQLRRNARSL